MSKKSLFPRYMHPFFHIIIPFSIFPYSRRRFQPFLPHSYLKRLPRSVNCHLHQPSLLLFQLTTVRFFPLYSMLALHWSTHIFCKKTLGANAHSGSFFSLRGAFNFAVCVCRHICVFIVPQWSTNYNSLFILPPHRQRYLSGSRVNAEARNRLNSAPQFSHRRRYL